MTISAAIGDWLEETRAARNELLRSIGLQDPGSLEVLAVGIATVELERAEGEYGGDWAAAPGDRLLGASVRRSTNRTPPWLFLLEPDTDGRLAGGLARHGEGPIAVYLGPATGLPGTDRAGLRRGAGPLGPQQLVLAGPPAGPFVILVGDRAPRSVHRVPSAP